ncbi:hypothetical protein PRUPE_6G345800 [Prunus persica]|uniref:Uncharacterized protein n=2 Tax=Prunus persica TaxID=3760 RepID=A0A251NZW7_PRUPE|nr:hypothetical protein PRUPE_6G345800 [Prunus persica]
MLSRFSITPSYKKVQGLFFFFFFSHTSSPKLRTSLLISNFFISMGKSQHSSNSKCFCKKIFSVTCPVCKLAQTHVSAQEKSKVKAEMPPPTKILAEPIHVKANSKVEKQNPKLEAQLTKSNRTASLGYNDAFSDYISRAKIRIRAMSNVGMGMTASRSREDGYDTKKEDNGKDTFSDYINRAKMRIRKTSSIGSRKLISFKRE